MNPSVSLASRQTTFPVQELVLFASDDFSKTNRPICVVGDSLALLTLQNGSFSGKRFP